MSDDPGSDGGRHRIWSFPSWRRTGDFFLTILQLEKTCEALKADNRRLREMVETLQHQVDNHNGQLKVLSTFVQAALTERAEMNAEKAAARQIDRMIAQRSDPPDGAR